MTNSSAEELPHDKEEKTSLSMSFPILSLPDEVALSCLARVSISDYAALSLVSKRYRSLVFSPELYKTRSIMGRSDKCLYLCLHNRFSSAPPRWYILCFERTLDAKSLLIPIPLFPCQPLKYSSVVVFDWEIYVIGGMDCKSMSKSSDVWLLDCRTNTWCKVPSMIFCRAAAAAGVVDGKIYVIGGWLRDMDSTSWGEVFDPQTQTWNSLVPMLDRSEGDDDSMRRGIVIEEKVYAMGWWRGSVFYYSPGEGKWGRRTNHDSVPYLRSHCVMIDKLLYCCDGSGNLFWCVPEEFKWKQVKGLDPLWRCIHIIHHAPREPFLSVCSRPEPPFSNLRHFGENILVFWRVAELGGNRSEIWCAEISLERREEGDGIWGTVEWLNSLITLDHPVSHIVDVLYSVSVNP